VCFFLPPLLSVLQEEVKKNAKKTSRFQESFSKMCSEKLIPKNYSRRYYISSQGFRNFVLESLF